MKYFLKNALFAAAFSAIFSISAFAGPAQIPVGYIITDIGSDPATSNPTFEFDIVNQTGINSSGDSTWPVTTEESLSNPGVIFDLTSLTLNFLTGPASVLGPSYFAPNADGISYDGNGGFGINFNAANPIVSATITGTFDTTAWTLFDLSTVTVGPSFSATVTDVAGALADTDNAVIYGTSRAVTSGTPEPASWLLFGSGFLALFFVYRAHSRRNNRIEGGAL